MTDEEINALTDQQINVMMTATIKRISNYKVHSKPNGDYVEFLDCVGIVDYVKVEDYCNDPAVMMPIVFASGISLIKAESGEDWTACFAENWNGGWDLSFSSEEFCEHTNPLRAAAIVYLKMRGVL